jgi:glutaredoxin-like protein
MSLLSETELAQARARLASMAHPVRLLFFAQSLDCDSCDDTRRLLADLSALTSSLTVEEHNLVLDKDAAAAWAIDRVPSIAVAGDRDVGIRFLGAPVGHEFAALLEAIVTVSGRASGLSTASRAKLATLTAPIHIQVFSTPTCVYCSQAVALAHKMAVESPHVTATAVSVIEYPDLIRRYRVTGVPKIVIGDRVELLGSQREDAFVDAVLDAAAQSSPEALSS